MLAIGATVPTASAASPVVAKDSFSRTVDASWGQAQLGGKYTVSGNAHTSVNGSHGIFRFTRPAAGTAVLNDVRSKAVDLSFAFRRVGTFSGKGLRVVAIARRLNAANRYEGQIIFLSERRVALRIVRRKNGADHALTTLHKIGQRLPAGGTMRVRFRVSGTSPTTIRLKAWRSGTREPGWQVQTKDSSSKLARAGSVGVAVEAPKTVRGFPASVHVDDLKVRKVTSTPTPRPDPAGIQVPSSVDSTGSSDASAALQRFVDGVPNGSTIVFRAGGTYRMDDGLQLSNRRDLVLDGNGATLRANGSASRPLDSIFALMFRSERITIRDFTLVGNNPDAGTRNAFHGGAESLSGVYLGGATDIVISGVTMRRFYGDCVYIGTNTLNAWSERITFRDSTCTGTGRHGVAVIAARDVTIQRVRFDDIGFMVIDIEPDRANEGATDIMIRDNTIGSYGLTDEYVCWVVAAYAGADAPIRDVSIIGNTITGNPSAGYSGRALGLNVVVDGNVGPRSGFVVRDNTSTRTVAGTPIRIGNTNGVTVTGNRQPLSSGSLATFPGSSNVTYRNNDTSR